MEKVQLGPARPTRSLLQEMLWATGASALLTASVNKASLRGIEQWGNEFKRREY